MCWPNGGVDGSASLPGGSVVSSGRDKHYSSAVRDNEHGGRVREFSVIHQVKLDS
jgi:hypothetical protein